MISWQQACGVEQTHLTQITDHCHSEHWVNTQVLDDLNALLQAAHEQGIPIALVSSFRSFDRQLAIWNDKWMGYRPVYSRHGRPLNIERLSDIERYKAIALWSALPGMSRHHWGTDFDIFSARAIEDGYQVELIPDEFSSSGVCCELESWLKENLNQYGFFRPYEKYNQGVAEEPWHISHQAISQQIYNDFDYPALEKLLATSKIKAKSFILERLEHYRHQYFANFLTPD